MSDTKAERTDLQRQLFSGELYQEVIATERALRSSHDYDIGDAADRRLAVLCHALQQSAAQSAGTAINLHGAFSALKALQIDAKSRR